MLNKISVELGKNQIKIVEGRLYKKLYIKDYFEINIDDCEDWTESSCSEQKLADLIESEFNKKRISKSRVNFVLSCIPNLIIREMVIPYVKERESLNIIKYEAKDFFPVDFENYVLDYKVIEVFEEDNFKKQRVLVVVISKDMVEKVINVSKLAGIKINNIDIEANALTKYVNLYREDSKYNDQNTVMIVNFEEGFATVVIVKNQLISVAKTFPHDLFRVQIGLTKEEADFKRQYILGDIVDNIIKVSNFYSSREHVNVEKIYITGELSTSSAIKKALGERSGIQIETVDNINIVESKMSSSEIASCPFAVTAGGLIV